MAARGDHPYGWPVRIPPGKTRMSLQAGPVTTDFQDCEGRKGIAPRLHACGGLLSIQIISFVEVGPGTVPVVAQAAMRALLPSHCVGVYPNRPALWEFVGGTPREARLPREAWKRPHGDGMTAKPGILHIITDLRLGGAQRMLLSRIQGCPQYRHSVAAFAAHTGTDGPDLSREVSEAGARLHILGVRGPLHAVGLWITGGLQRRMDAIVREEQPAIIHSTLFHGHLLGAVTASRRRIPHLASKESMDAWMGPFHRRLEARVLGRADGVAAVSEATAEAVRALGIPGQRIRVIPNGIDLGRMDATPETSARHEGRHADSAPRLRHPGAPAAHAGARAASACSGTLANRDIVPDRGAEGDTPTLIGIGRLSPVKGWEDLLAAFAIAHGRAPALTLEIHGHGPVKDRLLRMAGSMGLSSSFSLCEPGLEAHEIFARCAAPVLVVPSREEGFGLVLLEAMAAGVPIIATKAGGIPEVVRDGVEALLAPPRDPEALSAAILRVAGDPTLRARMAEAGRHRVREFDIAPILVRYGDWVDELTGGTAG